MPKKDTVNARQTISDKNKTAKTKVTEKYLFENRNKNIMNRPATLYEILLVKIWLKNSDQEILPQNEPVDAA